jgi:hypothetical protein
VLLALLHPVVLGAALRVQGEVTCPEPGQVAADVQKILEISTEYAPQLHADLSREGAWLELTLTGADGTSLGERRFEANEDCAVLSHTVAVVLATWLSDEHPEYVVALPTGDSPPKSVAQPSSGSAAAVAPEVSKPAPPSPAPPPAPLRVAPARAISAPVRSEKETPKRYRLAPSAALGGALGSSEFASAAWLGVSLDPGINGLGVDLTAAWVANRSEPLATHEVRWSRWPVLLGPYLRLATPSGRFDLGAGATLALLRLEGRDFSANFATSHAAFGSYAGLRFLPKTGAWQPFFMIMPVLWFGHATAFATGADGAAAEARLPSLDLLFAAGLRFLP